MMYARMSFIPRRSLRRGFGVAPILYMLGLIGVLGGTLFSNYMQTIKTGISIQNGLMVRNDLMGASTALAAQSVFSANNFQLCPPRSVHESSGEPCDAAPIGLIQFADFPSTQYLPANYGNAASTGSPVEVGVFTVGVNKQLDAFGHTYIYCRWENSRAKPDSPAFVLISAGPDGILQTKCGDTVAQGDDYMISFPVAEAISHASLWQPNGTTDVSYGAAGSQVVVDASGDLTAAGSLNAASAAITNGVTAATVTTTGDVTAKDFIGLDNVSGSLGSFVNLDASSAAITNSITASTLTTSGDITGKDLAATGTVSGTTGSFVTLDASSAAITNGLTATSLTASGDVTGASGTFTALNGTNAVISNGITAADIIATSTGTFPTLNATNATVTGASNLGSTSVSGLTDSGNASVSGTLSVTGATTGSTATYSGIVTAAGFSGSMSLGNGGVTLSGVLPVANGGTGASSQLAALNNLGVTSGGIFNTGLLTAGLINGAYLTANSVTSTQLNTTGVASGTCPNPTVGIDGRITACGSATVAAAAGTTGNIQFNNGGALGSNSAFEWDNTNDRLGIGTAAPDAQLEIYGTLPSVNLASTQNNDREYQFINDGNYAYIKDMTDALGEFRIRSNANSDVARFSYAAPSGSFYLSPSGAVGIDTTSASQPLTVSGNTYIIGGGRLLMATTGTPVVTSGGDYTSGIGFSGGSNTDVGIWAAGTEQLVVKNSGYVGIGTTNPNYPLHVVGSNNASIQIQTSATSANTSLNFASSSYGTTYTGVIQANWGGQFDVWPGSDGTSAFTISNAANTSSIFDVDTTNGRVGIGTLSPKSILDVEGGTAAASTNGANINLVAQNGGAGNANGGSIFLTPGKAAGSGYAGSVLIGSGCSAASYLANGLCVTGLVQSGGGFSNNNNSAYNWGTGTAQILGNSAGNTADFIELFTDSLERLVIEGNGNVGIGTAIPAATLDVYGSIDLRGINGLMFPTADTDNGGSLAIGSSALKGETVSAEYDNTAIGYQAMTGNMTSLASDNVAVGAWALQVNTSGNQNTAVGEGTLENNTSGSTDTAIGEQALIFNTTGSLNTAIGMSALMFNTTGTDNTALGVNSLADNTSGKYNLALGESALQGVTTGKYNIGIGYSVGLTKPITGSDNILIGTDSSTQTAAASTSNTLNIGNALYGTNLKNNTNSSGVALIGINSSTPAATLDINGYTRLAKYSSAPTACSAANDGAIALNHTYTLCVCNSSSGWVTATSGTAACAW